VIESPRTGGAALPSRRLTTVPRRSFDFVRAHGVRTTLRKIRAHLDNARFDRRYGVHSDDWVAVADLAVVGENQELGANCQPIKPMAFDAAMDAFDIPRDGVFVDLGSGAGRALMMAARSGFRRLIGVEFAIDGYDFEVRVPELGSVGEYAIYTYVPQLRLRYPVLDGRLAPYFVTGVGMSFGEFKDRKPHGQDLDLGGEDFALAAVAGVGVEYFVASNIALGLETKYLYSRDHTLKTSGPDRDMNLDSMLTSIGLRIYFGKRAGES